MTIVMIGQKGLPARSGGIERHVEDLAQGLAARGHKVVVFGRRWYGKQGVEPHGVVQEMTYGIHTKHLDALTHSFTALLAARKHRPHVIHIHGVGIGLLSPLARLLYPSAKVIVTFHCLDRVFSKWGLFARFVFRLGEICSVYLAHKTITVSQYLLTYCLDAYGCQTAYIPHSFRVSAPASTTEVASIVAKNALRPGQYFLFVSRLLPHKGAHLAIEAYRRARQLRPDLLNPFELAIVGSGAWTDSYIRAVERQAREVPGVKLLGEIWGGQVQSLRQTALANIAPSWEEGLSVGVLEAGASGRPVIVSDIGPNLEATGGYAPFFRSKDIEDLCRALIRVAEMPEVDRLVFASNTHAYIKRQFDFTDGIDQVERLYRELCFGEAALTTPIQVPSI